MPKFCSGMTQLDLVMRSIALAILLSASNAAWAGDTLDFAEYPGAALYHGHNAVPILATEEARQFRTMIRNGAREKPNFDGHYIVSTWGCGTDCEMGAIIDAISGKVVSLPVVAGTPQGVADDDLHFAYRLNSRMIVMNGMIREAPPMGSHYFEFDGTALKPLKTIERAERRFEAPPDEKPQ